VFFYPFLIQLRAHFQQKKFHVDQEIQVIDGFR